MALATHRLDEPVAAEQHRFRTPRRQWSPWQGPADYDIGPVYTAGQQGEVSTLVQRRYAWRGYNTDALAYRADDPNRLTLAAWYLDELVATLTLGRDCADGLQTDALYAAELANLRHPERVLCEVSRLAVDPDFSCPELLQALFQAALDYGKRIFAANDVVIGVNPRHAGYYRRRMGFRQLGALQYCSRVEAPVVLLHQVLDHFTLDRGLAAAA